MAILGKLFGKSGSAKASLSADQDRARMFLSAVPGQSNEEQDAVRRHTGADRRLPGGAGPTCTRAPG